MSRSALLCLGLATLLAFLSACGSDEEERAPRPQLYPAVINYWRPISDPNVMMPQPQAQNKLEHDLAHCRCSNFPQNYPQSETAQMAPDLGRLAETEATKVDTDSGCQTTPEGVLIECMRARGWEPTTCSGRLETPGGTTCALAIGDVPAYPESYPYHNPYAQGFEDQPAPPEQRQRYP